VDASLCGRIADGASLPWQRRRHDEREVCLVVTRWRSEDDFRAWVASRDFAAGHSQHRERGPVGRTSELWSFDVLERKPG